MLYGRWQEIARDRANDPALAECASGRRWTFAELARAAEALPRTVGEVCFPRGNVPEFILNLLAAWRDGKPALPLEAGQPEPTQPLLAGLPRSIAHLKLTSGTTGLRQLIVFTGEQLAADADHIVRTMGLLPDRPNLGVISLAHSYGFSNLVTPLLLRGIPLILAESPMPESVKSAAAGHRALTLPAVPAMWRAWRDAESIPESVVLAISAGAPLPVELERAVFARRGLKLHNFYGSSECGGIAYDASGEPRESPALAGTPLTGVNVRLGDDNCLEVSSPAVGTGYWPGQDPRLGGGRFQTTDLAELRDGRVWLLGRASDVINVAGRKLAPETVEAVVRQLPGVRECVAFGVPARDAARSEEIAVALSLDAGTSLADVVGGTTARLAGWQLPRHWWKVEALEADARGKLSRREWRERFLRREGYGA